VEEKARAKDAPSTSAAAENGASANVVVGKNNHNNKNKGKMQAGGKPKKTTNFKKKNTGKDNGPCFVCVWQRRTSYERLPPPQNSDRWTTKEGCQCDHWQKQR
jgi:hypothetical protein